MLQEGTVFAGRYRIVRRLATGGMGRVYEARHLETDRLCALKVMLPQLADSEEFLKRFKLEARVAAHVNSEHIVDVVDAGFDEATQVPYLVMELLHGQDLGEHLKRVERFSPADAITYLYQTALALDKAHRANIVHRDLKPENLFFTTREDGVPWIKVLDFGIAKLVAEHTTSKGATTSIGTPVYMAPEQMRHGQVTPAVDIFALGMMAYTFVVGIAYWAEEVEQHRDVIAFALATASGPREWATRRAARQGVTLPTSFDSWFACATALNPGERFATATKAVACLADVFGLRVPAGTSSNTAAKPPQPSNSQDFVTGGSFTGAATVIRPPDRRRGFVVAVLVLGGLIAAGAVFLSNLVFSTQSVSGTENPVHAEAGANTVPFFATAVIPAPPDSGPAVVPSDVPSSIPSTQPSNQPPKGVSSARRTPSIPKPTPTTPPGTQGQSPYIRD